MNAGLTERQLEACRYELVDRQRQLIEQLKQSEDPSSLTDSVGELSSIDNHSADIGTELFEREKDFALQERAEEELAAINRALHAMEEGTYGICRVCSMNIDYGRLQSLPMADTCIEHADWNETESLDKSQTAYNYTLEDERTYSSYLEADVHSLDLAEDPKEDASYSEKENMQLEIYDSLFDDRNIYEE